MVGNCIVDYEACRDASCQEIIRHIRNAYVMICLTDVDHIKPHRGDLKLFWDRSNWQALCHRHHSMKTRAHDNTPTYHY